MRHPAKISDSVVRRAGIVVGQLRKVSERASSESIREQALSAFGTGGSETAQLPMFSLLDGGRIVQPYRYTSRR
jgi:hypothetical protein